MLENTGQKTD